MPYTAASFFLRKKDIYYRKDYEKNKNNKYIADNIHKIRIAWKIKKNVVIYFTAKNSYEKKKCDTGGKYNRKKKRSKAKENISPISFDI